MNYDIREIIGKIFENNSFNNKWEEDDIVFYQSNVHDDFFLTNYIDCTNTDQIELKNKFLNLENYYVGNNQDVSLKIKIKNSLKEDDVIKVDKNLSAIYIAKVDDYQFYENKNLLFDIEESPYFFKRYVLTYTDSQIEELNEKIDEKYRELINYKNEFSANDDQITITECLSRLLENDKEYYNILNDEFNLGYYELLIRLFSKLPFLAYDCNPISMTFNLEKNIKNRINNSEERERLQKLHDYFNDISTNNIENTLSNQQILEDIIDIENKVDDIEKELDDYIEKEVTKLLEDAKNGL